MQDAVGVADGAVQLSLPVVAFDLRGQRIPGQAHAVGDKLLGDGDPVDVRQGGQMRAEGAGGAVDLAEVFLFAHMLELAVETVDEHGELFAQRGRRGRLAVGQCEQGHVAILFGFFGQQVDNRLRVRQPHLFDCVLHAAGDGQVVDVLARAGEMHEGFQMGQLGFFTERVGGFVQFVVDIVFDRLHVMMRNRLMCRMTGDALRAELFGNGAQILLLGLGQRLDAGDDRLVAIAGEPVGEQDHPFDFHAHALAVECRFAHVFHQGGRLLVIAPVERGQCDCWDDVSKLHTAQDTSYREPAAVMLPPPLSSRHAALPVAGFFQGAADDLAEVPVMRGHRPGTKRERIGICRLMKFQMM